MKQHPILFSTEMVQAIRQDIKTQTRRTIKPQPIDNTEVDGNFFEGNHKGYVKVDGHPNWKKQFIHEFCRYKIGDVLWVRESWNRLIIGGGYRYKADGDFNDPQLKWKPSIHMPKAACRIWLEITDIRMELLHDISPADALAEGIERMYLQQNDSEVELLRFKHYLKDKWGPSAVHSFETLWCKINGHESWNSNPWVWVISFKQIEKLAFQPIRDSHRIAHQ
jgi:hypothetical protein